MTFLEKLNQAIDKNESLLCVGLDPDLEKMTSKFKSAKHPLFEFDKSIIDATADLVCCYKPNSAFYEAYGADGMEQLQLACKYIQQNYSHIPVLLDYKRGDIGNTNNYYAKFAFDYLGVDAITLQPYQGGEALQPFFEYKDKGMFILVKTSNPGSNEFQNLELDGRPLYEYVTENAVKDWNSNGNIMMVAGATYPKELGRIREIIGSEMPILVPGVGAQGGGVEEMLKAGLGGDRGLIINASRQILYSSNGEDFAETAKQEATKLRDEFNKFRGK